MSQKEFLSDPLSFEDQIDEEDVEISDDEQIEVVAEEEEVEESEEELEDEEEEEEQEEGVADDALDRALDNAALFESRQSNAAPHDPFVLPVSECPSAISSRKNDAQPLQQTDRNDDRHAVG